MVPVAHPLSGVGAKAAVVAKRHHLVAHPDHVASGPKAPGLDFAGRHPGGPGPGGQGVDGVVVGRHDQHRLARLPGLGPGGMCGVDHLLPGAAGDAPVVLVGGKDGCVPGPQAKGGSPLPGVLEAPHRGQLGRRVVGHQGAEQAPCAHG